VRFAFRAVLIAAAVLALSSPARAQMSQTKMPDQTKSIYIAMLYEKFLHANGGTPDFEEWVRKSPDYDSAELYQRPDLVIKNSKDLKATYDLLTPTEPIVLAIKAHISGYSPAAHGFLVQNFQNMAYFDYAYLGKRYALVPNGISNYQWLKAVPEEVKEIMRETDNGRSANLVLSLVPIQVDTKPMDLNGRKYNLMMADISKIEMWSKDGSHVIWDDKMNAPASVRSKILDLFQR
jgi:hypothetical protein